jgi:hypothetical protein
MAANGNRWLRGVYAANAIRRTVEVEVESSHPARADRLSPGSKHQPPRTGDRLSDNKMNDVIFAGKYGVTPAAAN